MIALLRNKWQKIMECASLKIMGEVYHVRMRARTELAQRLVASRSQ